MRCMIEKSQAFAWLFLCRLIFAMAMVTISFGCTKHTAEVQAIAAGTTVLVLGDSISYGTGAEHGTQDYPTLLARKTGWQVINAGISGDVSSGSLTRLPSLLAQHRPRLVIIELGGNDFLRQMAPTRIEDNLKSMVHLVQQADATAILIAMPEVSLLGRLHDHPLYARVAEETGAVLVSNAVSEVLSDGRLRADQVHPNAEGYRQLTDVLTKQFHDLGVLH
jgi:acyl-CoA thioesterase I